MCCCSRCSIGQHRNKGNGTPPTNLRRTGYPFRSDRPPASANPSTRRKTLATVITRDMWPCRVASRKLSRITSIRASSYNTGCTCSSCAKSTHRPRIGSWSMTRFRKRRCPNRFESSGSCNRSSFQLVACPSNPILTVHQTDRPTDRPNESSSLDADFLPNFFAYDQPLCERDRKSREHRTDGSISSIASNEPSQLLLSSFPFYFFPSFLILLNRIESK